jgi:E3 ubiquitin-protein ligase UBR2
VIEVLKAAMTNKMSTKQATDLAEFVDREGRAIIVVGTYKDCAATRDRVEAQCRALQLEMPLKTKILPSYIVAHQNFAIRLLNWLTTIFSKCSGFRALFANVFFCVS